MNSDSISSSISSLTLRNFSITPEFMQRIYSDIEWGTLKGSGSFGKIYTLEEDKTRVLKVDSPCSGPTYRKQECDTMNRMIKYRPHGDKTLLELNSVLIEGTIGAVLNSLIKYTPHFVRIDGTYYSAFHQQSFMVMEKLGPNATTITDRTTFVQMLFQVLFSLYVAQTVNRFVHFDLHFGNILMLHPKDGKVKKHTYRVPTEDFGWTNVSIKDPVIDCRIIDFGLSRLEKDGVIVNQTYDSLSGEDYGQFNPYYDVAILYGSLRFFKQDDPMVEVFANMLFKERKIPDGHTLESLDEFFDRFRPTPAFFETFRNELATVFIVLRRFVGYMIEKGMMEKSTNYSQTLEWDINPRDMTSFENTLQETHDGINVSKTLVSDRMDIEGERWPDMYMIQFDSERLFNEGARFRTVCCKLDPATYLKHHRGVAINGADSARFYSPAGAYRQALDDIVFESNVPTQVESKWHGWVTIDGGRVGIEKTPNHSTNDMFQCGPWLVQDGKQVMTSDVLDTAVIPNTRTRLFHCNEGANNHGRDIDCQHVKPGGLFHASKKIRRSMVMIDKKGFVAFVVIDNATVVDLAEIASMKNAQQAIALGVSTPSMAWRFNDSVHSTSYNNTKPTSNLLVLEI